MLGAFSAFAVVTAGALLWLLRQLKSQAHRAQELQLQIASTERRLAQVWLLMKDHDRQRTQHVLVQRQLNARLVEMEARGRTTPSVSEARDCLKQGQNLKSLVQQGTLNQSEAHLISLLHQGRKRQTH